MTRDPRDTDLANAMTVPADVLLPAHTRAVQDAARQLREGIALARLHPPYEPRLAPLVAAAADALTATAERLEEAAAWLAREQAGNCPPRIRVFHLRDKEGDVDALVPALSELDARRRVCGQLGQVAWTDPARTTCEQLVLRPWGAAVLHGGRLLR